MWQKHLKQLKKQPQPKSKKPAAPEKAAPKTTPEVNFAAYCLNQYITPLKQDQVILKAPQKNTTAQSITNQRQPATENSHSKLGGFEFFDEGNALTEFFRFGQKKLPLSLRNGKIQNAAKLDLHNLTKAQAINRLEQFIANHPMATVIAIIHGQGLNSAHNQPILQGAIRKYLEYHPRVMAFSQGSPAQGGAGVTLVKLKS